VKSTIFVSDGECTILLHTCHCHSLAGHCCECHLSHLGHCEKPAGPNCALPMLVGDDEMTQKLKKQIQEFAGVPSCENVGRFRAASLNLLFTHLPDPQNLLISLENANQTSKVKHHALQFASDKMQLRAKQVGSRKALPAELQQPSSKDTGD